MAEQKFVFTRGKPGTQITREIYSRIKERWAEQDMMAERFPVSVKEDDEELAQREGYVESNVHFSWSNVVDWFGNEGRRIKEILWEMEIE